MNRRKLIAGALFASILSLGSIAVGTTSVADAKSQPAASQAYFVDILYLNEGKTAADAKAYFDKTVPVVAKHGLRRTNAFVVTQKMAGSIEPQVMNVWTVSDPQNTFTNIFADPAYQQYIPMRNATFDMSRSHMFMLNGAE